jgi:hypothetical protein
MVADVLGDELCGRVKRLARKGFDSRQKIQTTYVKSTYVSLTSD